MLHSAANAQTLVNGSFEAPVLSDGNWENQSES